MEINENTRPGMNWQCEACPHPPKPSNPPEINDNQRKSIKIHVLASVGNVQAFSQPPYFSKPLGTIPNAFYDGNQYAKKEVGGRGGAHKFISPPNSSPHPPADMAGGGGMGWGRYLDKILTKY